MGYEADGLRARISDFGLAKRVNPLTLLATAAGTISFKPPEAFSESKGDSCSADVWAIGTTLYLLLTDHLPYKFPSNFGWGSRDLFNEVVRPASDFNADVNGTLDIVIARSLSIQPGDRYANAMEMLDALEQWRPGTEHAPAPSTTSEGSKAALGTGHASPNEQLAQTMAGQALELKKQGRLPEAADLMEEAFNKWPELRRKYDRQVRLWRCGISM